MTEKIQESDEGYYVQHGDVLEWRWKDSPPLEAKPVTTEEVSAVVKPKRKKAAKK